jgi:hypothetical protein
MHALGNTGKRDEEVHDEGTKGLSASARHVENGVCSLGLVGQCLDRFVRGQNQQIDFSTARLEFHLFHHRKRSISARADYEALALPGYFLCQHQGLGAITRRHTTLERFVFDSTLGRL